MQTVLCCFASQMPTPMIGSDNTNVTKFKTPVKKLLQPINAAEEAQYPISYSLPSFTNPNPKKKNYKSCCLHTSSTVFSPFAIYSLFFFPSSSTS